MIITFRVNLTPTHQFSDRPPFIQSAGSTFITNRSTFFPDSTGCNREFKHGDEFTVSGLNALYLKNNYTTGDYRLLDIVSETTVRAELATLTTTTITDISYSASANSGGYISDDGGLPITARGVCWSSTSPPTIDDEFTENGTGDGSFTSHLSGLSGEFYYVRAYATNEIGTAYGNELSFQSEICLAKGTRIRLTDYTYKNIEDIDYNDNILVWNFDEGKFDSSYPLWIKKPQTTKKYNLLKFSNGTELKTINQHRIFSKEQGKFVHPMVEETPIGTTTFDENGEEITLISKEVIHEEIEYFNVITDYHINLFADSILTSCRYNNIYPIENMKFIKDDRTINTLPDVPTKYLNGLRLDEQTIPIEHTEHYIERLMKTEKVMKIKTNCFGIHC